MRDIGVSTSIMPSTLRSPMLRGRPSGPRRHGFDLGFLPRHRHRPCPSPPRPPDSSRYCRGLDLQSIGRLPLRLGRSLPLRYDALQPRLPGVGEHGRPSASMVPVDTCAPPAAAAGGRRRSARSDRKAVAPTPLHGRTNYCCQKATIGNYLALEPRAAGHRRFIRNLGLITIRTSFGVMVLAGVGALGIVLTGHLWDRYSEETQGVGI